MRRPHAAAGASWTWCAVLLHAAVARRLERLVIVGRHSVKNPYPAPGAPLEPGLVDMPLQAFTGRPFPEFTVPPGSLTPQGRALMKLLGEYFKERYGAFLARTPCNRAAVFADPEAQRSVDSAEAFMSALLGPSGCPVTVNAGAARPRMTRIFRATADAWDEKSGCGPPSSAELEVLLDTGAVGKMSSMSWLRVYRRQLGIVQDHTHCCTQEACGARSADGLCTIFSLPPSLAPNVTWRAVGGPMGVASKFAEIFVMQLCNGMDAGWGLREEDVVELMSLLHVPADLMGANAVTSQNLGSELLSELLRVISPPQPEAAPALAAYFGHDSNIQFLRKMLGLEWLSDGWWPNVVEPGALLVFEVYSEGDEQGGTTGGQTVRVVKIVATPRQQRLMMPLSVSAPPSVVSLWVPGCGGVFCPLARLVQTGLSALRPACVQDAVPAASAAAGGIGVPVPERPAAPAAEAGIGVPVPETQAPARPSMASAMGGQREAPEVKPTDGPVKTAEPDVKEAEGTTKLTGVKIDPKDARSSGLMPPPPESSSSNSPSFGTVFFLLIVVLACLAWRWHRQRGHGRGYETLGGSRREYPLSNLL